MASAVVNIKKSGGKSLSNKKNLQSYVDSDWDLIKAQINEINPDLIICGSTWPLIKEKCGNPSKIDEWLYKFDSRYFVDFWHPANHYPNKLNYYSLITILNNSRDIWLHC